MKHLPARRLSILVAILLLALPMTSAQLETPDPPLTGQERAAEAAALNLDRQVTHLEALSIELPEAAQSGISRALEAITAAMTRDVVPGLPEEPPSEMDVLEVPGLPAAELHFPDMPNLPDHVTLPELPNLPDVANVPELPNVPNTPDLPDLPEVAHGR